MTTDDIPQGQPPPPKTPELKFKGVWIPREIWCADLSWTEKILWATISSYSNKGDPCYASNAWLADRLGTSAPTIANMVSKLRKAGLVCDEGFNGRQRFLTAVCPASLNPQVNPSVNPGVKGGLTPRLTLEGAPNIRRDLRGEEAPAAELELFAPETGPVLPTGLDAPEVKSWNSQPKLRAVKAMTGKRVEHLKARRRDQFWRDNFEAGVLKVARSEFCTGKNDRGWKADFDWFLKPDSLVKVMEGKYANAPRSLEVGM